MSKEDEVIKAINPIASIKDIKYIMYSDGSGRIIGEHEHKEYDKLVDMLYDLIVVGDAVAVPF